MNSALVGAFGAVPSDSIMADELATRSANSARLMAAFAFASASRRLTSACA